MTSSLLKDNQLVNPADILLVSWRNILAPPETVHSISTPLHPLHLAIWSCRELCQAGAGGLRDGASKMRFQSA